MRPIVIIAAVACLGLNAGAAANKLERVGGYLTGGTYTNETQIQRLLRERGEKPATHERIVAQTVRQADPPDEIPISRSENPVRRARAQSVARTTGPQAPAATTGAGSPAPDGSEKFMAGISAGLALAIGVGLIVLLVLWVLVPVMIYLQLRALRSILLAIQANGGGIATAHPAEISTQCPTCSHSFSAIPGIKVVCPRCGERVRIDPPGA